jgi:hypothetical protein
MADQGRWFKLWCSAATDPSLANLSLEDFARWCLFGLYLKEHGTDGMITVTPPARGLCERLRVQTYPAMLDVLRRFPNTILATGELTFPHGRDRVPEVRGGDVVVALVEGGATRWCTAGGAVVRGDDLMRQPITICWRKWRKYQADSNVGRRRSGAGGTGVETWSGRQPKKRREEKRPPNPQASPPEGQPPERPSYGRQTDGSYRIHDGMFNDCPDGKAGLCVKTAHLGDVPTPKQCARHKVAPS